VRSDAIDRRYRQTRRKRPRQVETRRKRTPPPPLSLSPPGRAARRWRSDAPGCNRRRETRRKGYACYPGDMRAIAQEICVLSRRYPGAADGLLPRRDTNADRGQARHERAEICVARRPAPPPSPGERHRPVSPPSPGQRDDAECRHIPSIWRHFQERDTGLRLRPAQARIQWPHASKRYT
jgi:hypothetical protein